MYYFIVNEHSRSGKGAEIWREVEAVLKEREISYQAYKTEYEGHAFQLSHDICELQEEDIRLIVLGGDGSANEVLNGMTHFEKVKFGVIPTGSGNDLARGLGIKGSPTEQLEAILSCEKEFVMDLGEVSWNGGRKPRLFAISAGTGLDALVCKKALKSALKDFLNKIHLGKLTYILLTIESLFTMETTDGAAVSDGKGQKNMKKMIFCAAMNFRAEGGGVPMAPAADAPSTMLMPASSLSVCKNTPPRLGISLARYSGTSFCGVMGYPKNASTPARSAASAITSLPLNNTLAISVPLSLSLLLFPG